jgi:Mn2+/Fe2+ NRAMP family transporter
MKTLTPAEAKRTFGIPIRKLSFLIRRDLITPIVDEGRLLVSETELGRYLALPAAERREHHFSYLATLGPGVITGASDDDPSGIGTYSAVGSAYGLSLTWLALYLLPMMTAVQETVARIGIVTSKGLTAAIGHHYGRRVLYVLVALLFVANTVNIGADIGAMVASLQLLVPINFAVGAIVLTLVMIALEVAVSYKVYARYLKWLTLSLGAYIVTGIVIHPDWLMVLRSLAIPKITLSAAFISAMVAVMGTTISPYLFFWQASEEVEEERSAGTLREHHKLAITHEIREMRKDTYAGMALANIVFLFIVITTAFVLFRHGITNISSAAQAAQALRPLAGNLAYLLFTLGIFGVGLLAVPVLAGSSAYAIAELLHWREGLYRKYSAAKGFYGVIIVSMVVGLAMNFLGVNPIKALYYAAVLNGVTAPVLMFFIFRLGRDRRVMGDFTNPRWVDVWGAIATVLMGGAAIGLVVLALLGK